MMPDSRVTHRPDPILERLPRTGRSAVSRGALAALFVLAAAGCTAGPDFTPPPPPAPSAGYGPSGPGASLGTPAPSRWWESFGSAELNALVERALANNQSLAAADATLERTRQNILAVAGRRLPQVDANARAEHEEINLAAFGFNPATFPGLSNPVIDLYTLGGGVTYDLDLWGKNRRSLEQARADAQAQVHQTEAAHLTIAGRVVLEYLAIANIRDRIATQRALIGESQRNVDLTQARQKGGEGTMVDVLSARAQLAADDGELPALQQQLAEARDMLAVLLGISPAELGPTDYSLATLAAPQATPVALPSALVHQRPDILTAEARLHAAVAAVGVATANLYPDVTLGASYTQSSDVLSSFFASQFRGFDIFGGLSAPIFHGGTLKAEKRGAEAEALSAAASYRETVLEAFGQVSDLLSALDTDAQGLATAQTSADLAQQSLVLSRKSFQVGNSGILQVLDANRLDERARLSLVDATARRYQNIARLYVATAGGWTGDPGVATAQPAPPGPPAQ